MGGLTFEFIIDPLFNLYYHLERAAPSILEHFSEEYQRRAVMVTGVEELEKFMLLLGSPQRILEILGLYFPLPSHSTNC